MSRTVISVKNLSKQYRLGTVSTGSVKDDLSRWWATVRGKEDPTVQLGSNGRAKTNNELVWALKDINFDIQQGQAVGIIGKNGAGKSTLLKILSRTTAPTHGSVKVRGRIASLLEVGTGFHPELTGRENIFLNGAILGMTKGEVKTKLDEIIDFSGVEKYIDTPVKRYSSGMYVRLAFAVAAHLESEILILDEVLAVGDAEFQKKCLGKMGDVAGKQGRTVIFVSHNMAAVKQLCEQGIFLAKGGLVFSGTSQEAVDFYLNANSKGDLSSEFVKANLEDKDVQLVSASITNSQGVPRSEFDISEDVYFHLNILCEKPIPRLYGYVAIKNSQGDLLIESDTFDCLPNVLENLRVGENRFTLRVNAHVLAIGEYVFYLSLTSSFANQFVVDGPADILCFTLVDHLTQRGSRRTAKTSFLLKWETQHAKQ